MTPLEARSAIAEELNKSLPDWHKVEALSRNIVDSDPDAVRFSVDAGHVQRLGVELVGKQETALSELIKNAYDADASQVTLTFENQDSQGGKLSIEDDGTGMTEDVIRSTWMRISTISKSDEPKSPLYDRTRAGRKGIGRFAVQRLGKSLTLITKPAGSDQGYKVKFEWDRDFLAGQDLGAVFNKIERFSKDKNDAGTALHIDHLRDAWSQNAISKVWRSILLLQPPHLINNKTNRPNATGQVADPGFGVTINGRTQTAIKEFYSIEKSFLTQAIAKIIASIDATGKAKVRIISEKLDLDDEQILQGDFGLTGPLELHAHYFIYRSDTLSGMNMTAAAEMGRTFGGIRVYRNGFRVLPYGLSTDDWLELDADVSRRVLLIPANNRSLFGHVELSMQNNPAFEETSSREGLLENNAFLQLKNFVRASIEWSAKRVASTRNRKQNASQKGFVSEPKKPSVFLQEALKALADPEPDAISPIDEGESNNSAELTSKILAQAEKIAIAYEEQIEQDKAASLEYEEMLRLLASLGLSISVFGHEVKGAQDAMLARLNLLGRAIEKTDSENKAYIATQYTEMLSAANRVFDIGGYIAGLMSRTESRSLKELSVLGAATRFVDQFSEYMSKQGVDFTVDVHPKHLRTTAMHSSELDAVFLNLLTNSIKSMRRARASSRKVKIDGRLVGKHVVIGFEDNGEGIPEKNRDRIFDAFFTTTDKDDEDSVAGPGTGLGLKIVSDIASSYGGEARAVEPSTGFNCRIEFIVLADTQTNGELF